VVIITAARKQFSGGECSVREIMTSSERKRLDFDERSGWLNTRFLPIALSVRIVVAYFAGASPRYCILQS